MKPPKADDHKRGVGFDDEANANMSDHSENRRMFEQQMMMATGSIKATPKLINESDGLSQYAAMKKIAGGTH